MIVKSILINILIFNKILEQTGAISTLELAQIPAQPQPVQAQQPQDPNGGGSSLGANPSVTGASNGSPQPVTA